MTAKECNAPLQMKARATHVAQRELGLAKASQRINEVDVSRVVRPVLVANRKGARARVACL